MAELSVILQHVSFTYAQATRPLIHDLSVHFSQGWTGIVGANGVGKTTLLKLATRVLKPQQGQVVMPGLAIYCEQRTQEIPDRLGALTQAITREALRIKGLLGVKDDWIVRWDSLSHGERKRAQLAVVLWHNPQVLAVDEPTNHLDAEAQALLFEALVMFKGVGLLVSHDRKLLDDLCRQCLFIDPPEAVLRPGNYSQGWQQAEKDRQTVQGKRNQAKQELSRLRREAAKRREAASQANQKRSKRGLSSKDHDAKGKIDLARLTGKDGMHGKRLNQLAGRMAQAHKRMDSFKVKKRYGTGIHMRGARSKRNNLLSLPAGRLGLDHGCWLDFPALWMKPEERVAITGPNGCGKSTLIGHIVQSLNLPVDQFTYIPQEIDIRASQAIMARARNLSGEKLGQMMTVVSRLGSRPRRLLESPEPSPGEIRKVLLATGMAFEPHLIIMDEPTNHLDLPSIQCLEQALADCPCGLLLVSHDHRFLATLAQTRWHISKDSPKSGCYHLDVIR